MSATTTPEKESRRISRISMPLPVRVEVKIDQSNSWDEITRMQDVSNFGTGLSLKRPVKRGRLVYLTMPMPRKLRNFDFAEPQYKVWGIVRRCLRNTNTKIDNYGVGVAFIGKEPPQSFFEDPSTLYDISHRAQEGLWHITTQPDIPDESDLPKELRRHSRFPIPISFKLETLDDNENVIAAEETVSENLSLSGASVFTSLPAEVGSFVRVTSEQFNVSIISIVRGKRLGDDNIPRLHIEFIDRLFPLEGIV